MSPGLIHRFVFQYQNILAGIKPASDEQPENVYKNIFSAVAVILVPFSSCGPMFPNNWASGNDVKPLQFINVCAYIDSAGFPDMFPNNIVAGKWVRPVHPLNVPSYIYLAGAPDMPANNPAGISVRPVHPINVSLNILSVGAPDIPIPVVAS